MTNFYLQDAFLWQIISKAAASGLVQQSNLSCYVKSQYV